MTAPRRTLASLVAAALAAVALVATTGADSLADETPTSGARAGVVDYVALGDSYSAAPLVNKPRPDPTTCLRSTNNYPAYLAGFLQTTTYRDVTCSGARVRDFSSPQTPVTGGPDVPAQREGLSAETDLVTVGIGGNDFGLFGSLTGTCPRVAPEDPSGTPCKKAFTNAHGVNRKYRDARRIQRHVGRGIKLVHQIAPAAQVVVVGYPRLMPSHGTCTAIPFATGDYAFARRVEYLLNRSLRRAAARHHATYVSTYGVSQGHDACAGAAAWINGSENKIGVAAAYHPFQKGERGMARAVYHHLTGLRAPLGGDAAPVLTSVVCNPPFVSPSCYLV